MPLFKIVFSTRYLAYLVDKNLKSHWEFCKLWLSKSRAPMTFCIGSETHSPSVLLLKTHDLYLFILLFHSEQQLERKYLAADENYSHTNVSFFIRKYHFIKERKL